MAWKEFEYSYIHNRSDLGYRPYIQVIVEINGLPLTLHAIIDSGSQDTLLNLELAPLFDLNPEKYIRHAVGGVGTGTNPGYETSAIIRFPEMNNVQVESPILFTKFPADMLLGQNNFFRNFNILFEGRAGKFRLNKVRNYKDEL